MNARSSFLRATLVPAALSAAVGLALALSAPAQAQYTYPGTASSSGHSARITPVRAGTPLRNANPPARASGSGSSCDVPGVACNGTGGGESDGGGPPSSGPVGYGGTADSGGSSGASGHANSIHPIRAGTPVRANVPTTGGYGNGNPSMRRGEACPPGSPCATPVPANGGGSGSGHATSAYGAGESYGSAAMSSHPVTAQGGHASISPVQAGVGHGALNYGTSQSASSFRNTMNGQEGTGPSTNVTGQQNSFTGPNGQTVNMGNQTVTGPNGQKIGQQTPSGTYGGGYGQQKGSGINSGYSYTSENGSMSGTRTGSAPGMASANGMNMNNGGTAGASDSASELNKEYNPFSDGNGKTTSDKGTLQWKDGDKYNGTDSDGLTWNKGKPWNGPDGNGGSYQNGHHIPGVQNQDSADMGGTSGPGSIVSASGKVIQPGKPGGSDVGGGQGQDTGTSGSGSNKNATGQYATSNTPLSGQDAPVKPKETGVLKVDYNGKLGVTDPTQNGGH